jgi:hypothetical protein
MSYARAYKGSVHYSGHVQVSYPASEHGGSTTEYYEGEVPIGINIEVDTRPFDNSVRGTHLALAGISGAVTSMEAAQCAAIEKTGREVSTTAVNGFYKLINSELSQQITECNSAVRSKFALMIEQSKAVAGMHDQMNSDFNRIKSRYSAVFQNLDEECKKRIVALDKQSFDLVKKVRQDLLTASYTQAAGFGYGQIPDEANSKMLVTLARLRRKVAQIIDVFSQSARKSLEYKINMERVLSNNPVNEQKCLFQPVVYAEEKDIETPSNTFVCFATEKSSQEKIDTTVKQYVAGVSAESWQPQTAEEIELINKSFMSLAEKLLSGSGDGQDRIYKQILALWEQNKPQTLTANA